jgi:hypothetical protein
MEPLSLISSPARGRRYAELRVEMWMEVCALAAQEQDPKKLRELTNEIVRLLDEKKDRPEVRRARSANSEYLEGP